MEQSDKNMIHSISENSRLCNYFELVIKQLNEVKYLNNILIELL